MLGFLRAHPYAFALAIALVTALLVWAYARTLDRDKDSKDSANRTFNKTLAAGVIAALALSYLVHRQEPLCTAPFAAE
jgi:hypothetical protein